MIKTFTHSIKESSNTRSEQGLLSVSSLSLEEKPSQACLRNILNFSKTLEVQKSELLGTLHYLRS